MQRLAGERLSDWLHRRGCRAADARLAASVAKSCTPARCIFRASGQPLGASRALALAFSLLLQSVLQQTQATGLFTDASAWRKSPVSARGDAWLF